MSNDIWISVFAATISTSALMWKMTYDQRRAESARKEDAGVIKLALEKSEALADDNALMAQTAAITTIIHTTSEKTQEKADAAYHEANSVNLKIEKLHEHLTHLKDQQLALTQLVEQIIAIDKKSR